MLFKIIPFGALSTVSDAFGGSLTGDTGLGFDITDSFHAGLTNPSYTTSVNVQTAYGGGGGTGVMADGGVFAGGLTPVADGISPASYGTNLPYTDGYGGTY